MEIDGYDEIMYMFYIAKKLHDIGKYNLVTKCFSDTPDYDDYFHGLYELISYIFEHSTCRYYERKNFELHVLSDPVIVDFYVLAGEYGKLNNISEDNNPYIKNAMEEVNKRLNISHCMDWMVVGHTEPKRPFHSRIAISISHDCDCTDMGVLAYRLIRIYEWFGQQCDELTTKIAAFKSLSLPLSTENPKFSERWEIAA